MGSFIIYKIVDISALRTIFFLRFPSKKLKKSFLELKEDYMVPIKGELSCFGGPRKWRREWFESGGVRLVLRGILSRVGERVLLWVRRKWPSTCTSVYTSVHLGVTALLRAELGDFICNYTAVSFMWITARRNS